jgi:hypothetical protein
MIFKTQEKRIYRQRERERDFKKKSSSSINVFFRKVREERRGNY